MVNVKNPYRCPLGPFPHIEWIGKGYAVGPIPDPPGAQKTRVEQADRQCWSCERDDHIVATGSPLDRRLDALRG